MASLTSTFSAQVLFIYLFFQDSNWTARCRVVGLLLIGQDGPPVVAVAAIGQEGQPERTNRKMDNCERKKRFLIKFKLQLLELNVKIVLKYRV